MLFIHGILIKLQSVTYIVCFFLVFINQSMVCFLDKDRTMVYQGNLYLQNDKCFVDEGLSVAANLRLADWTCMDEALHCGHECNSNLTLGAAGTLLTCLIVMIQIPAMCNQLYCQ